MHFHITDFILDIFHNAVEAGSSDVSVLITEEDAVLAVVIKDNGPGMGTELLKKALDPFYTDGVKHSSRKVGLGLPFLKQSVELCEGHFSILSELGHGTEVRFGFNLEHIDCPPIGSIDQLFFLILTYSDKPVVHIGHKSSLVDYSYSSIDLFDVLGGFDTVAQKKLLKEFLNSQEHT
jgi:hypothetical protein